MSTRLSSVPLTTLLAWTWTAFTIEADNLFEQRSSDRLRRLFRVSLPMWANGLRALEDDGITVEELRRRTGASCNLAGLERWGWVTFGPLDEIRRPGFGTSGGINGETVVRPTRAGVFARRTWPVVIAEVEQRWRKRFGTDTMVQLSARVQRIGRSMPWSPPEIHPSDGFYTHLTVDGVEITDQPLTAVLGQALNALTFEYEAAAPTALPLAANFLRILVRDGLAARDLPSLTGLAKPAVDMAVGYLERHGLAVRTERRLQLTPAGVAGVDFYQQWSSATEKAAVRTALMAILEHRQELSAGLTPPPGCWRAENPYAVRTARILADPPAALPWHPMVLHRGGWPDGS